MFETGRWENRLHVASLFLGVSGCTDDVHSVWLSDPVRLAQSVP